MKATYVKEVKIQLRIQNIYRSVESKYKILTELVEKSISKYTISIWSGEEAFDKTETKD